MFFWYEPRPPSEHLNLAFNLLLLLLGFYHYTAEYAISTETNGQKVGLVPPRSAMALVFRNSTHGLRNQVAIEAWAEKQFHMAMLVWILNHKKPPFIKTSLVVEGSYSIGSFLIRFQPYSNHSYSIYSPCLSCPAPHPTSAGSSSARALLGWPERHITLEMLGTAR